MPIESVMPSNHLILCCPLLLPPSIFPSIRVFSNELSSSHQGAKVLKLQLQSFQWISVLISFKMDCPRDSQESSPTPQFKSISSSILIFLYSPTLTWKNHSLDWQTFVGKVMSLLFNMLSRLVITFLPRSKHLWISWLQSPSAVILEPPKNKVCHCFASICHEVMGLDAMILVNVEL